MNDRGAQRDAGRSALDVENLTLGDVRLGAWLMTVERRRRSTLARTADGDWYVVRGSDLEPMYVDEVPKSVVLGMIEHTRDYLAERMGER